MLDAADVAEMAALGTLDDVVLHEIGHILGIGTVWPDLDLVVGTGGQDPRFVGSNAVAAYQQAGGTAGSVPVENTGFSGTRNVHWRESVLGNELMTGYLRSDTNPLSAITVGSIRDLGYTVNAAAASSYRVPSLILAPFVDLHEAEIVMRPRHKVDRRGVQTIIGS